MYAVVLIPDFELQCTLRSEPELAAGAVALLDESSPAPAIRQLNAAAHAAGVSVGMSLPQAQARCAGLVYRPRHVRQEAVATAAMLQAAERVSPYLENTFPGCCTLDLNRLGPTEHAAWARALVEELQALHLRAQVGVAPAPDAALQAGQLARPVLITADPRQSVADLPVLALGPPAPVQEVLDDWGILFVAELRALDRQEVAERLGLEGLALWDRAGGGAPRPLRLVRAAEIYEEAAEFDGGVETLEPVLFRLRRALEQLTLRLRSDLLLAGSIAFFLDLDDRSILERTIQIPAPTCDADVLYRVVTTYLDTVQTKSRVNGFRILAQPSTPRDHQTQLWERSLRDPNGFSETLARLNGIVGADSVGVPHRAPTHRPNRFHLEVPSFDEKPRARAGPATAAAPPPLGLSLRRYRPPRHVQVESEDERPARLRGDGMDGPIKACAGPWRLDGDWWDEGKAWRWEEWDVELATGGMFRLAQHRRQRWWMLGVYD